VSNDCVASDTTYSGFGGADISYSYANCGSSDDYTGTVDLDDIAGNADGGEGEGEGNAEVDAGEGEGEGNDDVDAGEGEGEEEADVAVGEGADEDECCDNSCGQNDVNINIAFNVDA
jgi:hypothetical protein